MVVLLPVLVLAEGAAVARSVAPAACLACLASTVPAALEGEMKLEGKILYLDFKTNSEKVIKKNLMIYKIRLRREHVLPKHYVIDRRV